MNKSALRKFAIEARLELREKVKMKALQLGITEDTIKKETVEGSDSVFIEGKQLSKIEQAQRNKLIERINLKGFNQVIEEVAYTWFNRFTALRFMEIHNYLPTKVRVLSSIHEGSYEPDIIKEALNINLDIDKEYVYNLKLSTENDATDKLYKHLILSQCNALAPILSFMFGKTDDYTIILFPDGLLSEGSFLRKMTNTDMIPESDWDDVEIIGWLYQYYITENNELVYDGSMKKSKIPKDLIPAATQIFTPNWVVKYMVENSLGKFALENIHINNDIKENWKYFIDQGDIRKSEPLELEKVKILDPAMGSGHMLVYAFEVLIDIYKSVGYPERDAVKLIIRNNLIGIDIDDRAYQLSSFAIMMKARKYNRRIFNEGLVPNFFSIQESNNISSELIAFIASDNKKIQNDIEYIVEAFIDAKEYGSILKVKKIDFSKIYNRIEEIMNEFSQDIFTSIYKEQIKTELLPILKQAEVMSQRYEIVITNPPYLNSSRMNEKLINYVKSNYPEVRSDFSMIFFQKSMEDYCERNGYISFITTTSWMFLRSFESIRKKMVDNLEFESLVDFGTELFDGKVGHNPIVAWVNKNCRPTKKMFAIKLSEYCYSRREEKRPQFFNKKNRFIVDQKIFSKVPGAPIAYWGNENIGDVFEKGQSLKLLADPKQGLATADNNRFLRNWFEVSVFKIGFDIINSADAKESKLKWFPYNKGGAFRKWYGNNEYIVNWENDGFEIRNIKGSNGKVRSRAQNTQYYFRESLSWSKVTSSGFSVRYIPIGFLFDVAGCSIFTDSNKFKYLLGFLNSNISSYLLSFMSQTLNYEVGHIANIPILFSEEFEQEIDKIVSENVSISKKDWDLYETSWDFKIHPLLEYKENAQSLEKAFRHWIDFTEKQMKKLKLNEEELNRIFVDIYGLQDELSPEIAYKDVTIRLADQERDIKSFISYAVGCMVGRYSLDEEGLIYAGGEFDLDKYKTFEADKDNILPIVEDAYFEDEIVSRFIDFVEITFGTETLNENLEFIADTLGMKKNETPKETIRRYFIKDFYKDHVKTYKKRPIYWLFSSGKQKAFNALIYMHRYDSSTLARIRTDYLHVLQTRLESQRHSFIEIVNTDESVKEKKRAEKQLKNIDKQIAELKEYDEVLHHMADKQIEIDLDDGVKVNYEKFKGLVAKI